MSAQCDTAFGASLPHMMLLVWQKSLATVRARDKKTWELLWSTEYKIRDIFRSRWVGPIVMQLGEMMLRHPPVATDGTTSH